jgi:hypothetical protein
MARRTTRTLTLGLCGALALAVPGLAGAAPDAAGTDGAARKGPVRCEIRAEAAGRGVRLEGRVHADAPVTGRYALKVSQEGTAGSALIDQSGSFTALPGRAVHLGTVTLGDRAFYAARLDVRFNGETVACERRVGGAL